MFFFFYLGKFLRVAIKLINDIVNLHNMHEIISG